MNSTWHFFNLQNVLAVCLAIAFSTNITTAQENTESKQEASQQANKQKAAALLSQEQICVLADERKISHSAMYAAKDPNAKDFKRFGADGFRAVCLLVEAGQTQGTRFDQKLKETWEPGLEKDLLKLCEYKSIPNYGLWTALKGLGLSDSKEVRVYLLNRLKKEQDAGLFMSTAQALGQLNEADGLELVTKRILEFDPQWTGVESHLMQAIYEMEPKAAVSFLEKYLNHEKARKFSSPLHHIAKQNPEKAKELALDILAREIKLDPYEAMSVKTHADKKDW